MIMSYRELRVWQKAMELVVECYELTKLLPKSEAYGLTSQMRRSSVSIPANIAEGHGREHLGDYIRQLSIANGSLMELETHLLVAAKLHYISMDRVEPILARTSEVGRMLAALMRKLRSLAPDTRHLKPDTRHKEGPAP